MRRLLLICLLLTSCLPSAWGGITISPQTFKVLEQAEKLFDQKAYSQAVNKIQNRLNQVSTSLEKALLLKSLATAYLLQGKHAQALTHLKQALAIQALPESQRSQILLMLGQLYLTLGNPREAIAVLETWRQSASRLGPDDHALFAQAYTELKKYPKALEHISLALKLSPKPQVSWLELRLALNYEMKNYRAAIADAKRLIRLHPDRKNYWQQLAGLYQLSHQTVTATAALELEEWLGMLDKEKEVLNLIAMLRVAHAPYLAAQRMQIGLESGQVKKNHKRLDLLAALWTEAREYDQAIEALEEAAQLKADGKTWLRLGQLFYQREQWKQAARSLTSALKRGGLKHPGQAWLLLGSTYLELEQLKEAREAFRHASKYSRTRQAAEQWMNYLNHLPGSQRG